MKKTAYEIGLDKLKKRARRMRSKCRNAARSLDFELKESWPAFSHVQDQDAKVK